MALSSLKDIQYSYSSKMKNPDTSILVRKPELDAPSLQSMKGTSNQAWRCGSTTTTSEKTLGEQMYGDQELKAEDRIRECLSGQGRIRD